MTGYKRMLTILNYLNDRKIHFTLGQSRRDCVMAMVTIVAARIEVEFFEDHIEYSIFRGDESVSDDQKAFLAMIDDYVRD